MLPENFVMPVTYQPDASHPMLMKPVFGTVGSQFVRFFCHHEYSEAKSKELKYEFLEPIEMCEIVCDRLTKAHIRVKDLSREQRVLFADLYERFKQGKESVGTHVNDWNAISDGDKALLVHCHIYTVEQLADLTPENMHRLGPAGKELQEKAQRHTRSKGETYKAAELIKEMQLLRDELESIKAGQQQKQEDYFAKVAASQMEEESEKRRPGRPKKIESESVSA